MEVMTGMDSDERLWEARLVADVRAGVRLAENELYAYCADYFLTSSLKKHVFYN